MHTSTQLNSTRIYGRRCKTPQAALIKSHRATQVATPRQPGFKPTFTNALCNYSWLLNWLVADLNFNFWHQFVTAVTGQLADTPTRGLPTRGLDDSRTGHLADWSTRGLDNSRTGQVADWTTCGCHRRLCVLSFPFWQHLRDPELSSPRVD